MYVLIAGHRSHDSLCLAQMPSGQEAAALFPDYPVLHTTVTTRPNRSSVEAAWRIARKDKKRKQHTSLNGREPGTIPGIIIRVQVITNDHPNEHNVGDQLGCQPSIRDSPGFFPVWAVSLSLLLALPFPIPLPVACCLFPCALLPFAFLPYACPIPLLGSCPSLLSGDPGCSAAMSSSHFAAP